MSEILVTFILLTVSPSGQMIREPRAQISAGECLADVTGFAVERMALIASGQKAMSGDNEVIAVLCEPCPCEGGPSS